MNAIAADIEFDALPLIEAIINDIEDELVQ